MVAIGPVSNVLHAPQRPAVPPELERGLRAIMLRVQSGEKRALTELYDHTRGAVYALVLRVVRDEGAAEEVTLDVYLQVYRRAGEYDGTRGSVLAWLVMLARSRAIDRVRARGVRERHLDRSVALERVDGRAAPREDEPAPEAQLALRQCSAAVQAALRHLSAEQREVIERAYFDGLSGSEIAAALAIPLGTVKSRIRAAMLLLRQHLGPLQRELEAQ